MRAILGVMIMLIGASAARADEEKVPPDRLPKAVAAAVKKRFPMAKITAAVKETEDKKTTYEVTLKDGTSTIDVDVTEAGTITGWEKEIAAKDLPKAVADAVAAPGAGHHGGVAARTDTSRASPAPGCVDRHLGRGGSRCCRGGPFRVPARLASRATHGRRCPGHRPR